MRDEQVRTRISSLLAAEEHSPESWWWLSFADPDGDIFLGVCVVRARGMTSAVRRTHHLGISPGGEVRGVDLATYGYDAERMDEKIPASMRNRLLSRAELSDAGLVREQEMRREDEDV